MMVPTIRKSKERKLCCGAETLLTKILSAEGGNVCSEDADSRVLAHIIWYKPPCIGNISPLFTQYLQSKSTMDPEDRVRTGAVYCYLHQLRCTASRYSHPKSPHNAECVPVSYLVSACSANRPRPTHTRGGIDFQASQAQRRQFSRRSRSSQ